MTPLGQGRSWKVAAMIASPGFAGEFNGNFSRGKTGSKNRPVFTDTSNPREFTHIVTGFDLSMNRFILYKKVSIY